jgi:hypothetical protein
MIGKGHGNYRERTRTVTGNNGRKIIKDKKDRKRTTTKGQQMDSNRTAKIQGKDKSKGKGKHTARTEQVKETKGKKVKERTVT